ncbi:MAG: hypothetical protein ACOC1X_04965 [Promethearchaeota archaeon]
MKVIKYRENYNNPCYIMTKTVYNSISPKEFIYYRIDENKNNVYYYYDENNRWTTSAYQRKIKKEFKRNINVR